MMMMDEVRLSRDEIAGISSLLNDPMKEEVKRIETFSQPLGETDQILASKGFFIPTRIPNQVQCFACGLRVDYPLKFQIVKLDSEHRKRSPGCIFMSGRSCNVPIVPNESSLDGPHSTPLSTSSSNNTVRSVVEPANRMILPSLSRTEPSTLYNRHTVNYELMKSEQERLNTFFGIPSWPVSFINPADCAHAGFFFLQEADKVQCAFCRGVAGEWEEGDVPMIEHRRHFPRCPFICNLPVGNVPTGEEEEEEESDEASSEEVNPIQLGIDVCGPFEPDTLRLTLLQDAGRVSGAQPIGSNLEDVTSNLAITTCRGPTHLHMVTPHARLKSFAGWPASTGQDVERMTKAGFYYVGSQDHVKCFYCGGGLRNWEARDDPWVEHARWFPKCTFVILNKGEGYIKNVVSKTLQRRLSNPVNTLARCNSSDEEELERSTRNGLKDVASSSSSSSSGIGSASGSGDICGRSPRGSTSSSSSSGHSSGEEDTEVSGQKCCKEKYLEEEVRKLREARQCKICMDNEVSVVFLPCGHLVSCTSCATAFTNCALCRQPIKGVVRTYMS